MSSTFIYFSEKKFISSIKQKLILYITFKVIVTKIKNFIIYDKKNITWEYNFFYNTTSFNF